MEAPTRNSPGAAVYCPTCERQFGGMVTCPWDGVRLLPLADADPVAVAFYAAIGASSSAEEVP